jgi:hypothetical protein
MSGRPEGQVPDRIRLTLDDETVERLRDYAEESGVSLERVVLDLLTTASWRVRELLSNRE